MNWDVWRSHGRIFAYLLMPADGGSDGHTAEQRSFRNPVHSLEKTFQQTMVLMESVYSECVPFGVLTHQMPTTQNGGTPNTKILCSENSFDPSYAT